MQSNEDLHDHVIYISLAKKRLNIYWQLGLLYFVKAIEKM